MPRAHLDKRPGDVAAMFDAMAGLLTQHAGRYFMTGESAGRSGNGHPAIAPYGSYPTADGDVVIANLGERFWPKIARAIGQALRPLVP